MRLFSLIWDRLYPNAILISVFVFIVALRLIGAVSEDIVPNEAFWLALGGLLTSLYQMMVNLTTPPAPPSIPAELAEKMLDKLVERKD